VLARCRNYEEPFGFQVLCWLLLGLFQDRFAIEVQVRSVFGRNLFRAAVEYDDEIKMRTKTTPKMKVLSSYNDNLKIPLYKVTRDFMNNIGCKVC
jgi:hypothetical protein